MSVDQSDVLVDATNEVIADLCALAEERDHQDDPLADRLWDIAHKLEVAQRNRRLAFDDQEAGR